MNRDELTQSLHQWIDIREGIQREINSLKPKPGLITGRIQDRIDQLEAQRGEVQQKILEIDRQLRTTKGGALVVKQ